VKVNYITQLTEALSRFSDDHRLNPTHVSLYLALFQFWNLNRFHNPVSISRSEVMKISKIGSNATYHRCIKDLHNWQYLEYMPSYNPLKGSLVHMFNFDTSTKQAVNSNYPKNEQVQEQALVPSINSKNNTNNNKTSKGVSHTPNTSKGELHSPYSPKTPETQKRFTPPSLEELKIFFSQNNSDTLEAEKYHNHFQSNGWLVGGKTPMKDWKAAARNWILRAKSYAEKSNPSLQRLNANQNTNYDEPL